MLFRSIDGRVCIPSAEIVIFFEILYAFELTSHEPTELPGHNRESAATVIRVASTD